MTDLNYLGKDIRFDDDLVVGPDGDAASVTGLACLHQDLKVRLKTPRGGLIGFPKFGVDIYRFLHAEYSEDNVLALKNDIVDQVESDLRIRKATAAVEVLTWAEGKIKVRVTGQLVTSGETFSLVIGYGAEEAPAEVRNGQLD
jgi:phage baseplate assembly protein W